MRCLNDDSMLLGELLVAYTHSDDFVYAMQHFLGESKSYAWYLINTIPIESIDTT